MFLLRLFAAGFLERAELIRRNVESAKEITRLQQENAAAKVALRHAICSRDDALGVVADLRMDLAAVQRTNDLLMHMTPSDLRALGESGPYDQEGTAG